MNKKMAKSSQHKAFRQNPSYRANLDLMKLLTTEPAFQEIVTKIRNLLEIPNGGFKKSTEIKEWTDKIIKKDDERLASKSFNDQEKSICEKLKRKEISLAVANKQLKLLYDNNLLHNKLAQTTGLIMKRFNLPFNFSNSTREYIITGKVSAPLSNFSISIGSWPKDIKSLRDMPYLPIKIYTKLTNNDLKEIKKLTNSIWGRNLPKYDTIRNIDRYIEIDEWNKDKNKFDFVEFKKYKILAKEISENVLGNPKNVQKIYDNSRSLKKLREKRFGI